LLAPTFAHAQVAITGFSPQGALRQAALEARLVSVPDTASAKRHARTLGARPHVAGTPAQRATADYVLRTMAGYGLDTSRVTFKVYLPYHDSTIVERLTPTRKRLDLTEPAVPGDPTTGLVRWPAMNGNAGAGDVRAPLIYVNYGLPADYAMLDSLGVSVRGRIVIARYGRSFRGIKAREAELHGAVGLLIYSDPLDDGFAQGDVYPDGPMRPPAGVQRGSIYNGQGDPTTPGWASTVDAPRRPLDSLPVPKIPVVPISYGNAEHLLRAMRGPGIPAGWQGGLPFRYHLGDETVRARVALWPQRGERAYKMIENTFGIIRGSTFPDEMVIVGGHRDAWGPGAADNVSGVVSILEAARAWGEALKAGERPLRTIVFATWDAEEWGLVGSTEWVELMRDSLSANAVAYLNQDVAASGRSFGSSGTASLHGLMRETVRGIAQPGDTASIYRDWARRTVTTQRPEPPMGDLGGGSDFAGFYNHLGLPSFDFGFGGPGGVYHSAYDTYTWMERFGDPGYLSHAAAGRLSSVLLARLANAAVVPLDHGALGAYLLTLVERTRREPGAEGIAGELDGVAAAARRLEAAGKQFVANRDAALARDVPAVALQEANRRLRRVELALIRPSGLVGRPFLRNLIFAADRDNGYANVQFPGIVEALRDRDTARAQAEARELAQRITAAAAAVDEAREGLPRP
jgi:N-acetylated-alpha-linked acidic dipeptidase